MDIKQMIGEPSLEAMPMAIQELMKDILEGNVRQFVIIAEQENGAAAMGYHILNESDMNPYTMSGAIMGMHRDYCDMEVPSMISLVTIQDEDDESEDDDV